MHSVGIARRYALLIAHAVQTGEDIISPRRHIRRERHLPGLAVMHTLNHKRVGKRAPSGLLIMDPPLAALCVT